MNCIENVLAGMALLALTSCGSDEVIPEVLTWSDGAAESVPQPELFDWCDCPVELTPPTGWERHRAQGPVEGVSFQLRRNPPGRLLVGHYRSLHRRHTVKSVASGRERSFEPPPPGFTLADVVDRVRFDPESLPNPGGVRVGPEVSCTVDGFPGLSLDYTWNDRGRTLFGREVYVVAEEQLFVATLLGTEEDFEVFESLLASIRFDPPPRGTP